MPNLIGYALPGQPAQLFFSLATDPGGRQTHVALRVEDEATVRLVHEFATAAGAEILHEPRLWPEYGPDYYAVFIRDPAGNNLELKCQASQALERICRGTERGLLCRAFSGEILPVQRGWSCAGL
jgi:hypothetical protein